MSDYYIGILILVCINLLAVLGLSLMTGFTGLFNFGQAGFLAVGAYTATILTTQYEVPFAIALLAGMITSALTSFVIGYPTLRLKGDYFAIATLGFSEAVRLLVENLEKITGGSRGIPGSRRSPPSRSRWSRPSSRCGWWPTMSPPGTGAIASPSARMSWPPSPSASTRFATSRFPSPSTPC